MYHDDEQREFARRLRSIPTGAEKRLWGLLRAERLQGFKFRRQAAIGIYIVDFVCFPEQLVLELDGPDHQEPAQFAYDQQRTEWLKSQGFQVLRFRNHRIDDDWYAVTDEILSALMEGKSIEASPPSPALPTRGRGPEGTSTEVSS